MRLHIFIFITLFFFIGLVWATVSQDETTAYIIFSSFLNKLANVSLLFLVVFGFLRLRDYIFNIKFPIDKINENSLSASIYYSTWVLSLCLAVGSIIG